jgi:uncharacterized protein (UPF0332 family)
MKKLAFLKKLRKEGKLKFTKPSENMSKSYLEKAENCFKSAKILFKNSLYENSVSEAYYCIYNSLLSLLFRIGIKSENHSGSIIIFEELFNKDNLTKIAFWAKEERIDKQYYTESQQKSTINKDFSQSFISDAEDFLFELKQIIDDLSLKEIEEKRKLFLNLIN